MIPADLYIRIRPIGTQSAVTLSRMAEMHGFTWIGDTPEDALEGAIDGWPAWAKDHPVADTKKRPVLPAQITRKDDVDDLIDGVPNDDEDLLG